MKDTLDIPFDKKTIPTRAEIKAHCKQRLLQDRCSEYITKLNQSVLRDAEVWVLGYVVGVAADRFQDPLPDSNSIKNFYLNGVYIGYIKPRIVD